MEGFDIFCTPTPLIAVIAAIAYGVETDERASERACRRILEQPPATSAELHCVPDLL
ncbi:hypothetical protein LTR53_011256, partial [Teratosphaeriaceae sp. CCFEE 6253]